MQETELGKVEAVAVHWRLVAQSWMHSRKATIYLVVFTLTNVAFFLKLINADQWIDSLKWSTASYMAANVVDGASTALGGKGQ
jgi:hypothetical protein